MNPLLVKNMTTNVCIVGCGPVGMVLSNLLNHLKVPNIIVEKSSKL